jgi:methylated-DNA-[protein]-cysteine S-methyltransferase
MADVLVISTPVGPLRLVAAGDALARVEFQPNVPSSGRSDSPVLAAAAEQLAEYFAGTRREFDVPLAPSGTPFQLEVWSMLSRIPYGRTWSYSELARRLGRPAAVRAVGAANGRNPLPIVVPCHRVIGADGRLVGFGGGLAIKRQLLDLEQGGLF